MTKRPKPKLQPALLVCAGLLSLASARAGTATYDFNSAPPPDLNFVGNAEWRSTGGVDNSGYIALFDSVDGQHAQVLIPDFDKGLVVKAFTFECDLRVGNPTGDGAPGNGNFGRPADGFSISYARADDPVVLDLEQEPPVDDQNHFAVAGGPENGTATGLAICFDTWQGNILPGNQPDIEGIEIIIDSVVQQFNGVNGIPMTTRNGACDNPNSLQTGPFTGGEEGSGPSDVSGLCWAHLKVDLDGDQFLTVTWKGSNIVNKVKVNYAPSAGRIVFAGRTGGANENTHIDNLKIVTVPSDKVVIGGSTGEPTGFVITLSDSGASKFDATAAGSITQFSLNGTAITATSSSKSTNGVTTLRYSNPPVPIVPGTTNTVVLAVKDTAGVAVATTNTFVGISYATLDPATAATGVDKTKPGFNLRIAQVDLLDTAGTPQGTDVNTGVAIGQAERLLHGDFGPNTADLTQYTGPNKTYTEPLVINYNAASGDIGSYLDDSSVAGQTSPSPNLPGMPGTASRESSYDDVAMEITTYIEFPKAGSYRLIFNSDDGFRTTTAANPLEVLNSKIVGDADVGRGAADTISWVYVPTAGIYPFRTLWFQGGGGANLEWAAINEDGVKALINDSTTPGALKAYRANSGAMPAAVSFIDPPRGSGRNPTPAAPVVVEVTDGSTPVTNIKFNINGTDVTPVVTKDGSVSKAVYTPAPLLPAGQAVTLVVSFTDGSKQYLGTNTFTTTTGVVVPASMAMKAADVDKTKPGFIIHTWQVAMTNNAATGQNSPGNSVQIGEIYAHQWWGWPNRADLTAFTGPNGSFVEPNVINYNGSSGNIGTYLDDGTAGGTAPDMPGINGNPDLPDAGIDNYALEILTVLDLPAGLTEMGVNSDDGFRLMVGSGKDFATFPLAAGQYGATLFADGGRGADNWGFTRFDLYVPTAGLYPFRLVFEEGGGGNNVEWFTITNRWLPNEIGKALINGPGGIKAYQYPVNNVGPTYVKSFAPGRYNSDSAMSVGRAGPDATVQAVIVDGSTPVTSASVGLKVNDAVVAPTVTQAGGQTTVTYKPTAGFAAGSTNKVELTFSGDRTNTWSFVVGLPATPTFWIEAADFDYDGGKSKPEASVMPYMGGAYAGLGAVAGTDYDAPNDADNPYYRYPNTLKVPVSIASDFDRGGGEVAVDYRLGWMGGNHWFNYTRTFPAGSYNVYAALSHGDAVTSATRVGGNLAKVTSGTATVLGAFDGPSTGGWGNNSLVPLRDAATTNTVVAVDLSGLTTIRYNDRNGDFDFLLFTPVGSVQPPGPKFTTTSLSGGNLTITWEGTGTLETSTAFTGWTAVTGVTGNSYTTPVSDNFRFYRLRQP